MNINTPSDHTEHGNNHHYTIIVNARSKVIDKEFLTYYDIIELAFDPIPSGPNMIFTITYRRGHGNKPEGILSEGESVKVKEGMIFDVVATNKS
ncbi:MAG TPA: multiubiquitin domain-containing protein [Candidatus Cloacimonadota bacterium]|nr:multiubiquitin domain-containing protein [Candidatus Cloacimonadota bacterium]